MKVILAIFLCIGLLLASPGWAASEPTLDAVIQAYQQFAHKALKLTGTRFATEKASFEKSIANQAITLVWRIRESQRIWYDPVNDTAGCVIMLNAGQYADQCAQFGIEHFKTIPEGLFRDLQGNKQYRLFDSLTLRLSAKGKRFYSDVTPGDTLRIAGQVSAINSAISVDNMLQISIAITGFSKIDH